MISLAEIRSFNNAALLVQASRSIEELNRHLLVALRELMPADACLVNWFGLPGSPVLTFYDPAELIGSEINRHAHLFLHQHPSYGKRYQTTSSISDHLDRAAWHRTDMYAQTYARVGLEDGLGLDFDFADGRTLTVEIDRRRRGFSAAERLLLDLLREHVTHAYRRLAPSLDETPPASSLRRSWLRLSREGRIIAREGRADSILARFFGPLAPLARRLPDGLAQWFAHGLSAALDTDSPRPAPGPFKIARGDHLLTVHCAPPDPQQTEIRVMLEERDIAPVSPRALSKREREVLHWLAQGKTNSAIALILGLSPGTVKRHLENIYAKLDVENRQSAILTALRRGLVAG